MAKLTLRVTNYLEEEMGKGLHSGEEKKNFRHHEMKNFRDDSLFILL